MIRGMGIDLCSVGAMRARMGDRASHFCAAHFTPDEMRDIDGAESRNPAQHAAARYAAKEACIKALSQASHGQRLVAQVDYREIEVVRPTGEGPALRLHGAMQRVAASLSITQCLVTLTHEEEMAAAVVVVS
jgi:holo-[acyl-carrier protein] synthase